MHQGSGSTNDRHSLVWGLDQPFNHSETRIQKDSVLLSGFTTFVWTEKGDSCTKYLVPRATTLNRYIVCKRMRKNMRLY